MLGYWPYATHNFFLYFLCKKHTSQLIAIKHFSQILKALINQLLNPRIYVETCSYIMVSL